MPAFHGLGRHEHLRHKENPVPEVIPHNLHPGDQTDLGQHVVRSLRHSPTPPAPRPQSRRPNRHKGLPSINSYKTIQESPSERTISSCSPLMVHLEKIDSSGLDGNVSSGAAYVSRLRSSCYLTPATGVFPSRLASLVSCSSLARCLNHRKAQRHEATQRPLFPFVPSRLPVICFSLPLASA